MCCFTHSPFLDISLLPNNPRYRIWYPNALLWSAGSSPSRQMHSTFVRYIQSADTIPLCKLFPSASSKPPGWLGSPLTGGADATLRDRIFLFSFGIVIHKQVTCYVYVGYNSEVSMYLMDISWYCMTIYW
jgi:hypothetical protein